MSVEFVDLYSTHFRRIAVQIHAYVGDLAEAQDLTQEAFCRALDRWNRISGYDDPAAWVRRVAMNLATSRNRRRRTMQRFLARQREEHIQGPNPDHVALTRALAALPEKHRKAVVQHHIGHMSTAEIAANEGVAEGTVRSWLSRGRSELAAQFSEFETASSRAVKPAGAEAAQKVVRRRKRGRLAAITAAAVAISIAVPVLILNLTRDTKPPIIDNTPTPTPTPTVSASAVPSFRVTAAGIDLPVESVVLTDGRTGWAYFHSCASTDTRCRSALASTTDGGRTWRRAALPDIPGRYAAQVFSYSATVATVYVTHETPGDPEIEVLLTRDGGATFTSHALASAPVDALLTSPGGPGPFRLLCPGPTWFRSDYATCAQQELVELGKGAVTPRPPLVLPMDRYGVSLHQGHNGRLWLRVMSTTRMRVAYSDDQGRTWTEVDSTGNGALTVSATDADVWISNGGQPLRLNGTRWETPAYIPAGTALRQRIHRHRRRRDLRRGRWRPDTVRPAGNPHGARYPHRRHRHAARRHAARH